MDWLGAGLNLGAAALDYYGQKKANKQNREEAARNRQFQERMSNTSWQRAVEDMRAAGINPMLAIDKGGASTPGGSMAQMSSETGPAVSSAMGAKRLRMDMEMAQASIANTRAMEAVARANADKIRVETAHSAARLPESTLRGGIGTMLNPLVQAAGVGTHSITSARTRRIAAYEAGRIWENVKEFFGSAPPPGLSRTGTTGRIGRMERRPNG